MWVRTTGSEWGQGQLVALAHHTWICVMAGLQFLESGLIRLCVPHAFSEGSWMWQDLSPARWCSHWSQGPPTQLVLHLRSRRRHSPPPWWPQPLSHQWSGYENQAPSSRTTDHSLLNSTYFCTLTDPVALPVAQPFILATPELAGQVTWVAGPLHSPAAHWTGSAPCLLLNTWPGGCPRRDALAGHEAGQGPGLATRHPGFHMVPCSSSIASMHILHHRLELFLKFFLGATMLNHYSTCSLISFWMQRSSHCVIWVHIPILHFVFSPSVAITLLVMTS